MSTIYLLKRTFCMGQVGHTQILQYQGYTHNLRRYSGGVQLVDAAGACTGIRKIVNKNRIIFTECMFIWKHTQFIWFIHLYNHISDHKLIMLDNQNPLKYHSNNRILPNFKININKSAFRTYLEIQLFSHDTSNTGQNFNHFFEYNKTATDSCKF